MSPRSANECNGKFNTQNEKLLQIWDEIQRVQTDFCFPQEISAYYMSDHWLHHTRSVLDVGTGNGYFLSKLIRKFPKREYMGIDISKELIEFARLRLEGLKAELRDQDYFTHHGLYDFVIMRLFWQHLSEDHTRDALEKLEELTRPGSSVLITDAYDEVRQFVPDIPAFRAMINAYTLQQTAVGRNRKIIDVLIDWAKSGDTWQVGEDIRLILPSSMYGYRSLFGRIYELWIELFECLGQLAIDFTEVKGELEKWSRNKASFTQAGLRVIRLDRLK